MARQFADAGAFRASVERRLRDYAAATRVPVQVIRRQAALERLIGRLMAVAAGRWALKGGLALETRLGERARASMDMDIDHVHGMRAAREDLARAATHDMGDFFAFAITEVTEVGADDANLALTFRIECSVAGVMFEVLQVDVTIAAPDVWEVEHAQRKGLLAAIGLGPIYVPLVPLERQVAEKLHAYTRTYGRGKRSTRPRDLIDLVLIRLHASVDADKLRMAIERTFTVRKTHQIPRVVPPPPASWRLPYRKEAERLAITKDLPRAHRLVATWLEPLLGGKTRGRWDPKKRQWR